MPRVALVDWANLGIDSEGVTSYRPDIPTGIGAWACLDLRDVGINKAIIYLKDRNSALPGKTGRFDFGTGWDTVLTTNQRNQLSTHLGISLPVGSTVKSIIGVLLLSRIQEDRQGRRIIRLFDQVLFDQPVIRGGASDTFTRADSADLGSSWDTIEATALRIVSNMVQNASGGQTGTEAWNTDLGSVDHYSQCDITLTASGFSSSGPTVRFSTTNGGTFYFARLCPSCGDVAIGKRVGFSISEFASGGSVPTSGFPVTRTLKLAVNGSGLEAFLNGTSTLTTTDTAITTSQRGGIRIGGTTAHCKVDNWEGNTLSAPPVTATGSITSTGTLTGTGKVFTPRTGSITSTGILTAVGNKVTLRTGSISGTGTLTGTGVKVSSQTGSISGTGVLTGTGQILDTRTGSISGTSVLTGTGVIATPRAGSITGTGILTGAFSTGTTGSISGVGTLAATGNIITPGAGFIETWNYADQSGFVGIDLNWTINTGGGKIISNTARTEGGSLRARADHDTGSDDVYAQAVLVHDGTPNFFVGVAVRGNASDKSFYTLQQGNDLLTLIRYQASGAFGAAIGSVSHTDPVGSFTILLTVVGSTLAGYVDGVQKITASDGTITTGERGGIAGYSETDSGVIWDDFVTGMVSDLPPTTVTNTGSIIGNGTLTGTGQVLDARTGSIFAVATLSGTGAVLITASASLVGIGILTAVEKVITLRDGSINGVGLLTATHNIVHFNTGSINGVGTLTGEGSAFGVVSRTGSLVAIGTLTANGILLSSETGSIIGVAILTGTGNIVSGVVQRSGAIFSTGILIATGTIIGITEEPIIHLVGISMYNLRPMCHVRSTVINPTIRMGTKG